MRATTSIACAVLLSCAAGAFAGPLNDFNLIVLGNHQTGSNVWGRVAVGGNMSGNAIDIGTRLTPPANYAAIDTLLVGGNLASNVNLQAGDVRHGGTRTGHINLNGGGPAHQQIRQDAAVGSMINAMRSELVATASALASRGANSAGGVGSVSNHYVFTTGAASAGGMAVFNIDGSLFSSSSWATFKLDNTAGADTIVFNVDAGDDGLVRFAAGNFDAATFAPLADRIVWNFLDATRIEVERELFGSMLGLDALLRNTANLNGSIAVGSFDQRGEVHGPGFSRELHAVPLPGPAAMAAAGLVAVAGVRRRRGR